MKGVLPYFTPPRDSIEASDWDRHVEGEWELLGSWIEDWDYRTRLRLRSTVAVDLTRVRTATGLHDGTPLSWSLGWRATDSRLVSEPHHPDVIDGENIFDLDVPPDRAGAGIVLDTQAGAGPRPDALASG